MRWNFLFVVFTLGIIIIFIIQNIAVVEIQFLFWSISITRSLLLLIIFAVGVFLGWLLKSFTARQKRKTAK